MKRVDRMLQRWRIRKGLRYIGENASVIDVGAHQGELFQALGDRLRQGFGVEPLIRVPLQTATFSIYPGLFPDVRPAESDWDAITMLAVLEHIPRSAHFDLATACYELLRPGGRIIITVPAKAVDYILNALRWLRLIDGMSLEEHFGFEPGETPKIFSQPRFKLIGRETFQFGLNHLFVFERT